jgi:hypothetical protein
MSAVTASSMTAHLSSPGWGRAPSNPRTRDQPMQVPRVRFLSFTSAFHPADRKCQSQIPRIDFREELGRPRRSDRRGVPERPCGCGGNVARVRFPPPPPSAQPGCRSGRSIEIVPSGGSSEMVSKSSTISNLRRPFSCKNDAASVNETTNSSPASYRIPSPRRNVPSRTRNLIQRATTPRRHSLALVDGKTPLAKLEALQVRGILWQLARDGQIIDVRCEMPQCYCFRGRGYFESRSSRSDWEPTADHYPRLKMHGGHLTSDNVRLAHRLCNRRDYWWRVKINAMLGERMSLETIAEKLNAEKVPTIHGANRWTAASVRKAFVS